MNRTFVAVLAVAFLPLPALSQGMTKAHDLLEDIKVTQSATEDANNFRPLSDAVKMKVEHASSYVVGLCDAWNSDSPGFVPSRVGWLEVMGAIRKYIEAHPEREKELAAKVARQAVLETYHRRDHNTR
jgi:hypothetical protein